MDAPSQIAEYRVLRPLGQGGMASVFECIDDSIGRRVAIKVLDPSIAKDPTVAERFLNEARAVNIISHPGIVQISAHGRTPEGLTYIVMELLRGTTLWDRLAQRGGKLQGDEVAYLGWQIADVVAAAHTCGIIHRDLKPENVMIVPDPAASSGERVKVLDFGIAKLVEQAGKDAKISALTRDNALLGTPLYMSPEQCAGARRVDPQTDVYSLGVMLYELLCGAPPFDAEGQGRILALHQFAEPPPLLDKAPRVDPALAALVMSTLNKDPAQRPTMAQLAEGLGQKAAAGPDARRGTLSAAVGQQTSGKARLRWLGLATAALAGLIAVFVLARPRSTTRTTATPPPRPAKKPDADVARAPALPAAPALLRWQLDSQPTGAEVSDKTGQALCTTPCDVRRPAGSGVARVTLRKPGYKDQELVFPDTKDVSLTTKLVTQHGRLRKRRPLKTTDATPAPPSSTKETVTHDPGKIRVVD